MMLTAGSCILSAIYCLLCGRSQKLISSVFLCSDPDVFVSTLNLGMSENGVYPQL